MQFYNVLAKTVWGYIDELRIAFCNDIGLMFGYLLFMDPSISRSRKTLLLLNEVATKLCRGDVVLFAKLLKVMQMYKRDADLQQLASQMQSKFEALNQNKSIGMMYHTHLHIHGV